VRRVLCWLRELFAGVVLSGGISGKGTPVNLLNLCEGCRHHHLRGDSADTHNHKCYAYVAAKDVIAGTRARPLCIHERSAVGRCGPVGRLFSSKSA